MKHLFLAMLLIGSVSIANAQEAKEDTTIYTIVEDMPNYPGGDKGLFKFISETVTYPQEAKDKGIEGVTYISYVVEKDGSVSSLKIVRGSNPYLDKEALRVVGSLGGFDPGRQNGEPVRVSFILPIRFELKDAKKEAKKNSKR